MNEDLDDEGVRAVKEAFDRPAEVREGLRRLFERRRPPPPAAARPRIAGVIPDRAFRRTSPGLSVE